MVRMGIFDRGLPVQQHSLTARENWNIENVLVIIGRLKHFLYNTGSICIKGVVIYRYW